MTYIYFFGVCLHFLLYYIYTLFLDDLTSKRLAALGSKIFFYVFLVVTPFLYTYYTMISIYNPPFFHFLFTNREYNSGNFYTTPYFCLQIVNNLQNAKYTKCKIFRRLQNTKYKIYFLY